MENPVGMAIRSIRREKRLSLREVAQRIGWSHGTLAKKETGESPILPSDLEVISRALDMAVQEVAKRVGALAEAMPKVNAGPIVEQQDSSSPYVTIRGDSMEPYYQSGDVLQVRSAQWGEQPVVGEPVIVHLHPESGHEGEAMFVWLPLANGLVRLGKANPKYPSIDIRPEHIGRLLRVVRVVSRAGDN